jgi:hypothetical protein
VLIDEDVELPPDRGVVAFAERLRAGWHPGDAESGQSVGAAAVATRATAPLTTMEARSNGKSDTTRDAVAAPPRTPVSGSSDPRWRRVGLALAVVTLLLAALWLLGARPARQSPHETPAPNDTTAPGRETGANRPPSGIGAR